jgi:hypothetical protein
MNDAPSSARRATDIQRVLALFAHGLAGRTLLVKPSDEMPSIARVSVIGTDGATVVVPDEIDAFATQSENVGAYLITVLHQLSQLDLGTYMLAAQHQDSLGGADTLLRRLFVLLEDRRVDLAVRRRYPGAVGHLDRVLARACRLRAPAPQTRRGELIDALVRWSLADDVDHITPPDPVRDAVLRMAKTVEDEAATAVDSGRVAVALCRVFEALEAVGGLVDTVTGVGPGDGLLDDETSVPDQSGGGLAEHSDAEAIQTGELDGPSIDLHGTLTATSLIEQLLKGQLGTIPDEIAWALDGDERSESDEEASTDDRRPVPVALSTGHPPAFLDGEESFLYDEWDYHQQRYREAWCRLYERRLRGDDHDFLAGVRRRHPDLAARIRRTFSSVRPESWQRVHTTSDGEELDLDAVITAMVDRRAGRAGDEHLYIRRERALREVAAAFLVDVSGSTSTPVPDPDATASVATEEEDEDEYFRGFGPEAAGPPPPPERRVLDVAKDAIGLMCDALRILGDEHAIYAFSGEGRDSVEFYVAKEFRDRPSSAAFAALAALEPRRYTRMGPAIRHAVSKLVKQPARTKVLIVVSDGYPQDKDYGPQRGDNDYGLHDTARALEEAERARITSFCVTVDPAGHDYLRRMCAEDRYLVIDDVRTLPRELTKIYRTLTGARVRVATV